MAGVAGIKGGSCRRPGDVRREGKKQLGLIPCHHLRLCGTRFLTQSAWERPTSQLGLWAGLTRHCSTTFLLVERPPAREPSGKGTAVLCRRSPGLHPGCFLAWNANLLHFQFIRQISATWPFLYDVFPDPRLWVRCPLPDCCCLGQPISECSVSTASSFLWELRVPDISRP